ncbi:protein-glutamine gamma-glutamyltransferase 2 [Gadus morhua]|uniref:Protein-glutamine gamma-glutamyltransferase 2-like n=1 Tax=Gadus morhua TaxID=8049 RepID=A0A8C4YWA0_GADMO|nr:protein-glutamine gamma-glutamyltransferase 2-like [Gadus morhua]
MMCYRAVHPCAWRSYNEEEPCVLRFVNLEAHENQRAHHTLGLGSQDLVLRRGQPFRLMLLFQGRAWSPRTEGLVFQVLLGSLVETVPVQWSRSWSPGPGWSAHCSPGDVHPMSATIQLCSPASASVGLYRLAVQIESPAGARHYVVGSFVLLCNPWSKEDSVYMPVEPLLQEYVQSDCGLVYMGTPHNVSSRPWAFGQYEPLVLEACLSLLQVSPQHLRNEQVDYVRRSDPVYLSRVVCAMVNCNDDRGVLQGKWDGRYGGGVAPTEWNGSAEILTRWADSDFRPVRYGQCWVFACVLCTVMRVLGVPSRVVTVFNAAHDTNGNLVIEEVFTRRGEKCPRRSRDSVWNFHVWVECWMERPDLGSGFGGWQVLDPTPQERSAGEFCCGPAPVWAVRRAAVGVPYDTAFVFAAVDADVVRVILDRDRVLGRSVDRTSVGRLVCTKTPGADRPEDLTRLYKGPNGAKRNLDATAKWANETGLSPSLSVSLALEEVPALGRSIRLCVSLSNRCGRRRLLRWHLHAQLKQFDSNACAPFWHVHKELHLQAGEVVDLHHSILPSDYESLLTCTDIVNATVVVKDTSTKERVLATEEFSLPSPHISFQVQGGDSVKVKTEHAVHVSFTNTLTMPLSKAVLTLEGFGLFQAKLYSRAVLLEPHQIMKLDLSIMATCPGTKLLVATVSHGNGHAVIAREFHRVVVTGPTPVVNQLDRFVDQ